VAAPGAAYGPAKQWPVTGFRAVADWWQKQTGGRVMVVGAAADREAADAVAGREERVLNLAGRTTLAELMALLRRATCVVANDSGVMHLAAGLGVPGVGLFGCTDPVATGPLGGRWIVLSRPLDCAPCFRRVCRRTGDQCEGLRLIAVAEVCTALGAIAAAPAAWVQEWTDSHPPPRAQRTLGESAP
jgi:heptosyltransferase-2